MSDRETKSEAKPAFSVNARRAIRIDVDSCGDCPFYRNDTEYGHSCASDGHGDGKSRDMTLEEATDYEPPEWCPIRGIVVLIGGPRAER